MREYGPDRTEIVPQLDLYKNGKDKKKLAYGPSRIENVQNPNLYNNGKDKINGEYGPVGGDIVPEVNVYEIGKKKPKYSPNRDDFNPFGGYSKPKTGNNKRKDKREYGPDSGEIVPEVDLYGNRKKKEKREHVSPSDYSIPKAGDHNKNKKNKQREYGQEKMYGKPKMDLYENEKEKREYGPDRGEIAHKEYPFVNAKEKENHVYGSNRKYSKPKGNYKNKEKREYVLDRDLSIPNLDLYQNYNKNENEKPKYGPNHGYSTPKIDLSVNYKKREHGPGRDLVPKERLYGNSKIKEKREYRPDRGEIVPYDDLFEYGNEEREHGSNREYSRPKYDPIGNYKRIEKHKYGPDRGDIVQNKDLFENGKDRKKLEYGPNRSGFIPETNLYENGKEKREHVSPSDYSIPKAGDRNKYKKNKHRDYGQEKIYDKPRMDAHEHVKENSEHAPVLKEYQYGYDKKRRSLNTPLSRDYDHPPEAYLYNDFDHIDQIYNKKVRIEEPNDSKCTCHSKTLSNEFDRNIKPNSRNYLNSVKDIGSKAHRIAKSYQPAYKTILEKLRDKE